MNTTTEEVRAILIAKLDANHIELLKIAKDPNYNNDDNWEIQEIHAKRISIFRQLQTFKQIEGGAA